MVIITKTSQNKFKLESNQKKNIVAMTTGDGENREHVDAVHTRFREKSPQKNFFCFACYEEFPATSTLEVFQHYGEKEHSTYHSDCLYCQGKVYQYRDGNEKLQYFHNCWRWKRKIEK